MNFKLVEEFDSGLYNKSTIDTLNEGKYYQPKHYNNSKVYSGLYKRAKEKLQRANIDTDKDETIAGASHISYVLKLLIGLTGDWNIHHINYGTSHNLEHMYLVRKETHKDMHNTLIYRLLECYGKKLTSKDIIDYIESIPDDQFKKQYIELSKQYLSKLIDKGEAFSLKDIANKVRHK